jgi:hypothetical protein
LCGQSQAGRSGAYDQDIDFRGQMAMDLLRWRIGRCSKNLRVSGRETIEMKLHVDFVFRVQCAIETMTKNVNRSSV